MPKAGPENFLVVSEDFLSRQIGWTSLSGRGHSQLSPEENIFLTISIFLSFFLLCSIAFLNYSFNFYFLITFSMLLFLNFIFSYVYSTFSLYCIFSMFWFLYFTSFQCLFSFMGLFIGLITLFLVPLFILPFFSCLFFL